MRNIDQKCLKPYLERWDDLLRSPDDIPCWLPQCFWDWKESIGLQPGHPGVCRPDDA